MQHASGWACGLCDPQDDARRLSEGESEALRWAIRAQWAPGEAQWAAQSPAPPYCAIGSVQAPCSAPPKFYSAPAWPGKPPPPPFSVDVIAAQAEAAELRLALQQALDSEAAASSRALAADLRAEELEQHLLQGQGTAAALEAALASTQQHLAVAQHQAALQAAAEQRAQRLEAELERAAADRAAVQRQAEVARAEAAAAQQQLRDAQEQAKRAGECSRMVVEHAARQAEERGRLEEGARRLEALLAGKQREAEQAAGVQREQASAIRELQVSCDFWHRLWNINLSVPWSLRQDLLGSTVPHAVPPNRRSTTLLGCRTACASRASAWTPARMAGTAHWMNCETARWAGMDTCLLVTGWCLLPASGLWPGATGGKWPGPRPTV